VFEHFGFARYYSCAPGLLSLRHHTRRGARWAPACGVVVDAGFSFTHVLPVFDGRLVTAGVRRINLGGKALTNYLKELVSYRCNGRTDGSADGSDGRWTDRWLGGRIGRWMERRTDRQTGVRWTGWGWKGAQTNRPTRQHLA
jgi:Actin